MVIKVLLIGNGAREHAIAEAFKRSPQDNELYSYMKANNPGIAEICEKIRIGNYNDLDSLKEFANEIEPDFAFIGPEDPLSQGAVDALEEINIKSVGPKKVLAKLETSKQFTREIMAKYGIKGNPEFKIFNKIEGIKEFIESLESFVIKPDGLTGGKGVMVHGEHIKDSEQGVEYCKEVLEKHQSVIVEERLIGEEFSLQCITDGKTVKATPPVQDHKRAYVNDEGPNTGGMGSYSCGNHLLPFITQEDVDEGVRITQEVADALYKDTGEYYKGIMYAGLIVTKNGVKLIEYNARFGDPEAMNTMSIMKTDFIEVCKAVINGTLDQLDIEFENKATVCKYAVPEGYPNNPVKNIKIDLSNVTASANKYFASVDKRDDGLYMLGSRTIGFVGIADTIDEAEKAAEEAVSQVKGPVFHREDIGTAAVLKKRVDHMKMIME